VDLGLDGECPLAVASEDIQGYTGNQVDFWVETDLLDTLALVLIGNCAVEWELG
jgi:hypothetical protein